MNNLELASLISDQLNTKINEIYLIAACGDNSNLKMLLEDAEMDFYTKVLGSELKEETITEYIDGGEILDLFREEDKIGFVCSVSLPHLSDFIRTDDNEVPFTYKVSQALSYPHVVYGDTMEELLNNVKTLSEKERDNWIDYQIYGGHSQG